MTGTGAECTVFSAPLPDGDVLESEERGATPAVMFRDTNTDALVKRRAAMIGLGGLGAAWVGADALTQPRCPYSPADLILSNRTHEAITVQIAIDNGGQELYADTKSIESTGRTWEGAVPIGCSFPLELTVAVETERFGGATETITVPRPDPPGGAIPQGAAIRIRAEYYSVSIESDFDISIA